MLHSNKKKKKKKVTALQKLNPIHKADCIHLLRHCDMERMRLYVVIIYKNISFVQWNQESEDLCSPWKKKKKGGAQDLFGAKSF